MCCFAVLHWQPLTFLPVMLYCGGPFVFAASAMFCNSAGAFKENIEHVTQVRQGRGITAKNVGTP